MASNLNPLQGFIDLATAYTSPDNSFVNIIGIVVDLMPPTPTTKGEHVFTFRLLDRTLYNWVSGSEGLMVRVFKRDPSHLPKVQNIGDVVLIRSAKMITYSGQRVALSNFQTEYTVFPAGSIPDPSFQIAFQGNNRIQALGIERDIERRNMAEQNYVIGLKKEMSDVVDANIRKRTDHFQQREQRLDDEPPAKRQKPNGLLTPKFKTVSDLTPRIYADICGEVVKRISAGYGCDLYITDYTSNELLRLYDPPEKDSNRERDGDTFGYAGGPSRKSWPGPYGQLTMKINVKTPHAQVANATLNEGDFVLLQNVKTRVTDAGPWLEGDMWPDDKNPERIKVKKLERLDAPELQPLFERKTKYWATREKQSAQKQKAEELKTNKALKKQQKKQRKQQRNDQAADGGKASTEEDEGSGASKPDRNKHVRCSYEEVHISRIRDVLDPNNSRHTNSPPDGPEYILPFMNAKYRAKVRVVDYEPKALEDFAVPPIQEEEQSQDSMAWQYNNTPPKFEWYFSLLLEDATKGSLNSKENNRVWVHIHHQQAQFLFGNDMANPADLRIRSNLLAKLREKMFVLWGNLEESGGQALDNLPFECCIQEYGIEMDEDDPGRDKAMMGWQRMYSMFGVTIL